MTNYKWLRSERWQRSGVRTVRLTRPRALAAGALAGALLLAACGASGPSPSADKTSNSSSNKLTTLTISNESGGTWTCGFNPFNPGVNYLSVGVVYEPLFFIDSLTGKLTPWLVTTYAWSDGNKVLTWTIRKGVTFTDGSTLNAADVVYTFNLLKQNPGLDLNALWQLLSSVTPKGSDQVVIRFKKPGLSDFYYIADQTPIVPENIWSKIANPVSYADSHPVGTGPYTVKSCTPEDITYVKNPHYWQPGLPKIDRIEYPAFTSNTPANEELADGTAQWGGQFIPDIKSFYLAKSPSYHDWFPTSGDVGIFVNLTNPLLSNLAVRQAIAYGIDRHRVSTLGEYGYEPPANQTGVLVPEENSWYDSSLASKYDYRYDPSKAISTLEAAGFKRGAGGIFRSPSGKALSFSIINVGGNSDWVASVQVIASELAKVGIKLTPDNLASSTYTSELEEGKYQLAYQETLGITDEGPVNILRGLLYSPNTAPIGQAAASDYERYSSSATDAIFNQLAATTSVKREHILMDELQAVMLKNIPFVPVTEDVDWFQYNTAFASGWPSPKDPYAQPAPYNVPDWEVVLLHLKPKG